MNNSHSFSYVTHGLFQSREEAEKVAHLSKALEELLQESNSQQQSFREEKQNLINDKNNLQVELEYVRSKYEPMEKEKVRLIP